MNVVIAKSSVECGLSAGMAVKSSLLELQAKDRDLRVILASAPSQSEMLRVLTEPVPPPPGIDWGKVSIFHMDEYLGLAATHPASFRSYQLSHVMSRITPRRFEGICGEAADIDAECNRYSSLLSEQPIDLVCLGIGENGHLAFNDPPVADFNDPKQVKVVELDERCRRQQVNDGCFQNLEDVPRYAITLTIPTLISAKRVICTVPGRRKAEAVRNALEGPVSTACPASILREHPSVELFLDVDSASLLTRP